MDWYGFSVVTKSSFSKQKPKLKGNGQCSGRKGGLQNGGAEKGKTKRKYHVICLCFILKKIFLCVCVSHGTALPWHRWLFLLVWGCSSQCAFEIHAHAFVCNIAYSCVCNWRWFLFYINKHNFFLLPVLLYDLIFDWQFYGIFLWRGWQQQERGIYIQTRMHAHVCMCAHTHTHTHTVFTHMLTL